jgi:hypothetical protein
MKKRTFTPSSHDEEAEFLPSASGFDSEFRCPGKRALEAQVMREEDTAVAARGTRIHKALEESDFTELGDSDDRTAQRVIYAEGKLVHDFDFEGADVSFEQRFWDVDDDLNHTWSARIDALHHQADKRRLFIPDYKTGWGIPPQIRENWQMRAQAALAADQYDVDEVVTALIHPHHPESLYEVAVFTRDDLREMLDTVRVNVQGIQTPEQPRRYGGLQCQFCRAKGICPEYQAEQARMTQTIADWNEDRGYTAILRQTPQERGDFVRRVKEYVKNAQALLEQYVALAQEDASAIKGYRLNRRMTRSFTDEGEAMELVRSKYGTDLLYDALHLSLPDLEVALGKKLSSKVEAKAELQRLLSPVIKFTQSKYFLEEARSL